MNGATVMCLARGGRPSPEGASLVLADRDDPAAYDAVSGRDWDHVIDVSSSATHVAADELHGHAQGIAHGQPQQGGAGLGKQVGWHGRKVADSAEPAT